MIDGFRVYSRQYDAVSDDYETEEVTDVTARDAVISRLQTDTQYIFFIECFHSNITSPPSNMVVAKTLGNCAVYEFVV